MMDGWTINKKYYQAVCKACCPLQLLISSTVRRAVISLSSLFSLIHVNLQTESNQHRPAIGMLTFLCVIIGSQSQGSSRLV